MKRPATDRRYLNYRATSRLYCELPSTVVARSPDRATLPTEGFHDPEESSTTSWRPAVEPSGTVRRPCHNEWLTVTNGV